MTSAEYLARPCNCAPPNDSMFRSGCPDCIRDDIAELLALRAERDARQWISVADRLPEPRQVVLAATRLSIVRAVFHPAKPQYSGEGEYLVDMPAHQQSAAQPQRIIPAYWLESSVFGEEPWSINEPVTHWMPLPSAPAVPEEAKP